MMLLEKGEFIKEIKTGQIHWIEKVAKDYVTIALQIYDDGIFSKEYTNVRLEDFYTKYTDVKEGN